MVARYSLTVHFPVAAPGTPDWPPLSTSELLDKQPERRRLTVVFVCGPLREFFGTTAYSLGVAVALPMLKGVPKWVHGKRAIVEPDRLLSAQEVMERVYAYYGCVAESHLAISKKAA